jgi:hypothetical protein
MIAENHKTYKLLGANRKSYESASEKMLGGHRKDKIYGTLG